MTFPNEIEKTKKEIEVLTAKLALLEEMEKHKTPCEIAYKRWWGEYPGTETWTDYDETRWVAFQKGYNTSYEETVSKFQPTTKSEGVFDKPKPETLTLKQLLNKWEIDFAANWAKNRTSELYEEEVERFIQMFIEWLPAENNSGLSYWDEAWSYGFNAYRRILMENLK